MADAHLILNSYNQLCLVVSPAPGPTQDQSQLLALGGKIEEMLRLANEVRQLIFIVQPVVLTPLTQAQGLSTEELNPTVLATIDAAISVQAGHH